MLRVKLRGHCMTEAPRWPEWMDQKVLAEYIGKKPSVVRRLMKHGALPRPSRWGKIVLWNRQAVDRRLMMGGEDTLAEAAPGITPEQIRESVRRAREEDRKPYVPRRNVPPHCPGSITERVRRELRETKDFDLKNYKSIFDK